MGRRRSSVLHGPSAGKLGHTAAAGTLAARPVEGGAYRPRLLLDLSQHPWTDHLACSLTLS